MTSLMKIINGVCSAENSHSRSPLGGRFLLIALGCTLFALAPTVRAVDPPPVGGYPGDNTALGDNSLFSLDTSTGIHNTACGYDTLFNTTTGVNNTAVGWEAMSSNSIGGKNTAVGCDGLEANTTGSKNTAVGTLSLSRNTVGNGNIAIGFGAGQNVRVGNNNINLGSPGDANDSNTIRIGTAGTHSNAYVAGITGITVANGVTVVIGPDGHLGTATSSERYKDAIKPMDKASEAILALQPVTFRYKQELDPNGIPQFGLVAEQVEKVNPDLVARDAQGKVYSVRYEAINAMLLNEFLKEHKQVEAQNQKVQELEATVARLEGTLKEQAAQIQKVNEKVELNGPAPRMVTNN